MSFLEDIYIKNKYFLKLYQEMSKYKKIIRYSPNNHIKKPQESYFLRFLKIENYSVTEVIDFTMIFADSARVIASFGLNVGFFAITPSSRAFSI